MSFDPQSGGQRDAFGPSFRDPFAPQSQPRSGISWMWLLGCGGLCFVLCCGGGIGLATFGFALISSEVKDQIRDNPKFREHIGEVQEFEMDLAGSFSDDDDDTYRYRVRGTKGSGELTVKQTTGPDGDEVVEEAELRLSDGKKVQVVP
jgi:hypothetical protein